MSDATIEKHSLTGIDEAGRGPLAGPVVAAAVTWPAHLRREDCPFIRDSKKLSEKKRLEAFSWILRHALCWSYFSVGASYIDTVNIRQATLEAMYRSCALLRIKGERILIDGNDIPPRLQSTQAESVIGGDNLIDAISCASIIAKVIRDKMMGYYDELYPHYHFARHKGYGTKVHYEALSAHGPSSIHRKSFKIKESLLS